MSEKRFIGYFVGDTLVSIKDTVTNKRLNILQIVEVANKISDENEQLKDFIKKLADDTGEIVLMNGYVYRIGKVIK